MTSSLASPSFRSITIQLSSEVLAAISSQFWYAPSATVLTFDKKTLPALNFTRNGAAGASNLWFLGSREASWVPFDGSSIQMGGDGDDVLGLTTAPRSAYDRVFLFGGAGSDVFHVEYKAGANFFPVIMDASNKDWIVIYVGRFLNSTQFQADVVKARNTTLLPNRAIFEVDAEGDRLGRFVGSTFSDVIHASGSATFVVHVDAGAGNDEPVPDGRIVGDGDRRDRTEVFSPEAADQGDGGCGHRGAARCDADHRRAGFLTPRSEDRQGALAGADRALCCADCLGLADGAGGQDGAGN